MTIEQALNIKQDWTAEQARNDLERWLLRGERPADKVIALACKALEKQIPKKPNYKYEQTGNEISSIRRFPVCPSCESINNGEQYAAGFNEKYCLDCGQALDWSDKK